MVQHVSSSIILSLYCPFSVCASFHSSSFLPVHGKHTCVTGLDGLHRAHFSHIPILSLPGFSLSSPFSHFAFSHLPVCSSCTPLPRLPPLCPLPLPSPSGPGGGGGGCLNNARAELFCAAMYATYGNMRVARRLSHAPRILSLSRVVSGGPWAYQSRPAHVALRCCARERQPLTRILTTHKRTQVYATDTRTQRIYTRITPLRAHPFPATHARTRARLPRALVAYRVGGHCSCNVSRRDLRIKR